MLVTTDAIVLRSRKQGETSKIVTLYTSDYGKVTVIAKGAREMKSKFGASLEMGAVSRVVFYKKESAEPGLYLLSKSETLERNSGLAERLERLASAMGIIELLLRALHDEEANPELYALVRETLSGIARADEATLPHLEFRFHLVCARLMGFELDLEQITGDVTREISDVLHAIARGSDLGQPYDERTVRLVRGFFESYFAEHLPGLAGRSLKSGRVFGQL